MEKTIGIRIKELRTHYNLGVKEFALRCGLSHVAIFHFESGKTFRPQKASLSRIVNTYGTSIDWLLYGHNDMLPNGTKELYSREEESDGFWKDEAYLEIKSKNAMLEKEIERLWQMIGHFTNGVRPNLHRIVEA